MSSTVVKERPGVRSEIGGVSEFMEKNFRHFNARETLEAARAFRGHVDGGGKMFLALAGAMSTGELGVSLARMIREGKIHAISSTAANLEEDIFNLLAHDNYRMVTDYRDLTPEKELALRDQGYNRVTDTCIPENAMRLLEKEIILGLCAEAAEKGESYFPWEYLYKLFDRGKIQKHFCISTENSWVYAAWEKGIPIYTPGWEDSTLGNFFAAGVIDGRVKSHRAMRMGTEFMEHLVDWYFKTSKESSIGFFQIGGGIAGDFSICAVPLILQDLKRKNVPLWGYFAQISDSTTSYGSYSGAVPNEKITWYKISPDTPRFMIQSDATIVAPLIFSYVLGD
ncbi:MAG: deoxyhypusine synthase family protein [Elusimicrobia bacterium]|nr:deoxyhypusine synthase family protein [Elusimicrobiota bacterium]